MKTLDGENSSSTISEIANELRLKRGLVDEQLNFLYHNKEVDAIKKDKGENRFFINEKGFATVASKTILNDGKVINSQLYNNYASTIFQVLTRLTALATILVNFTSIVDLREENKELRKGIELQNERLIKLESQKAETIIKMDTTKTKNNPN